MHNPNTGRRPKCRRVRFVPQRMPDDKSDSHFAQGPDLEFS